MQSFILDYKITDFGNMLATKEDGNELCQCIIQELNGLPDGGSIILDFSMVKFIAISVVNQIFFLWNRVVSGEFGEKFILLTGLTEEVEESFQFVLRQLHGVMVICNGSNLELTGDVRSVNVNTWNYVNNNGGVSARDMHRNFPDLSLNACSNRLKRLYDGKLIVRTKKGSSYIYTPIPV